VLAGVPAEGVRPSEGDTMTVAINLPTPPSVNRIWRVGTGGRVYIDPAYNAWKRAAGWELAAQRPGKLPLVEARVIEKDQAV
jgi:Holliday junction resolvase RusA-like endonuclease